MEENLEKKPKRPRISAMKANLQENANPSHFEKVDFNDAGNAPVEGEHQQRPQQPRQGYGRQPYNQGYNRGYGQPRGGYQPRQQGGYNPNYQGDADGGRQADGYNAQGDGQGYQPRQPRGGYNNPRGGYGQHRGGYNQQRGGYHGQPQRGGYNQQRQQGGYNPQRGGYQGQQQRYGKPHQPKPQQQFAPAGPRPQMRFTPRPKPVEYEQAPIDPNAQIRLNKFMANAGVCSRREADELILKGLVKVNGTAVNELGVKITAKDTVEYDGKIVSPEKKCYVLLNKPKDTVTTVDDPNGRKTVMDLVKGACEERIYPVGRLDRNTTGVLLLTNDGDLASKLTHPKYVKKKIYQVWTDKPISEEDMQHIADGVELDDGPIHADAISYVSPTDRKQAGIEIHSGRNRVVRRIFESLGYHVVKLDRVYFAGLTKKNLPRGRWRYLTQEEVNFLKQGSFE